jgi:hypothetical protein
MTLKESGTRYILYNFNNYNHYNNHNYNQTIYNQLFVLFDILDWGGGWGWG